ncbi:MAG: HAMP domain-containing histidine kinase [Parvibaculaceae bacterium]|nr:HAMP domain-containing histidine kinase [Parvibaculaceae bacterium]
MTETKSQAIAEHWPNVAHRNAPHGQPGFGETASSDSAADYSMDRISLRFRQPELEERYNRENYERQIGLIRLSIAMGAVIFALYSVVDPFIIPEVTYEAWAIRLGLACPLLFAIVALSYLPGFSYKHQGLLSFAMVIPGLAVVGMIAVAEAPGNYLYYAGILIILSYANCLWRLRYHWAIISTGFTCLAYEYVALFVNPIPANMLINNNVFLLFGVGVSVFVNYVQEYKLRISFVDNEKLRAEQRRSERLLSRSEAANRAKNDFLAIMSHELRTPLNAIIGFSEIISNQMFGPAGQPKYVDYASDIKASGAHLLSIINDILDISKAEAGKLQLEEEPIDPVEALNRTMRMFRQRASELGVDLTFRVRDDIPWLIADPRLFNQVAINLTSNALKFTPENGNVWVELGLNSTGDLVLSVKDTGIGIKSSDMERIFEPFVQVEDAMSRTHQGTGLGLPLVRKIMNLHGGTIELESAVGEGTTAHATFPKSRFVAPEAAEFAWKAG